MPEALDLARMRSKDCQGGRTAKGSALEANGMTLTLLEWGYVGTVVILLHGITSSARTWWRVGPELAAEGYHAYGLDMPGHGYSEKPDSGYTLHDIARRIDAALQWLGYTRPILIGHSWGAMVALTLATMKDAVSRPTRLCLIDPVLRMHADRAAQMAESFQKGIGIPQTEESVMHYMQMNPRWQVCDAFWKAEAMELCNPAAVRNVFLEQPEYDLVPLLGQVRVPLLLMTADPQQTINSAEITAEAEAQLNPKLGKHVSLAGASHNMHRDTFDPFMETLFSFIGGRNQRSDEPTSGPVQEL